MILYIPLLIALIVGIVIGAVVGGAIIGVTTLRATRAEILLWLMTIERTTREGERTPVALIELPGYQGIVRKYRERFDV